MKIWKLNLYSHIFPYIASGKKSVEGIGVYYGIAEDWEERIRHGGIFAIRIHLDKNPKR